MKNHLRMGLFVAMALALIPTLAAPAIAEPINLSFVKFTVSDLPRMQAFYQKAFGLSVQKSLDYPGNKEVILTGPSGLALALVNYKDKRAITLGNANGPIGFYLQDVDAVYKSAMAAGATSKSAPRTMGTSHVAVVADPEGHDIELLHLPN